MKYLQRFAEATVHHQAALQTVANTPPPIGQKFEPGARVKIADDLGFGMDHFPAGKLTKACCHGCIDWRVVQSTSQYC